MGKKGKRDRQASMWVATADLPKSAGHPFYAQLNRVLDDAGFDTFVEAQCAQFYADGIGRPSLAPGRYFRLLLLGYFEGLDSERAIAWRAADSLSIRQFLDFALHEAPPDHSTLSRTRRLIDVETHQAVFTWVLQRLADAHLVEGHTIGIDATTLEANAAMRSIVRRDTGEAYEAWLTRLAEASGIATPTRVELARFDRKRKKKGSNEDWTHPHDPDAKITKMKDGRTHLAHTAEHAVDLETGAIVGVTVQDADAGDTTTMVDTLIEAADQVAAVDGASGIAEVVGDKGYHSNETMVGFADLGVRSYVSEPDRGRRKWKGKAAAKKAVYANRRRIRGNRGQRLLRQRGERVERPNAHLYETGGMRRVHLRGHPNILKRLLVHVCGFNLGLLMRQLTGVGTPRSLQGRAAALLGALIDLLGGLCERLKRSWAPEAPDAPDSSWGRPATGQCGTPAPVSYMTPRLTCAEALPWWAASRNHRTASVSSCGTPAPVSYMTPRLNCAEALPWSAASRNHRTASVSSCGTPRPVSYIMPSKTCAPASPCSASARSSSSSGVCACTGAPAASATRTATVATSGFMRRSLNEMRCRCRSYRWLAGGAMRGLTAHAGARRPIRGRGVRPRRSVQGSSGMQPSRDSRRRALAPHRSIVRPRGCTTCALPRSPAGRPRPRCTGH